MINVGEKKIYILTKAGIALGGVGTKDKVFLLKIEKKFPINIWSLLASNVVNRQLK